MSKSPTDGIDDDDGKERLTSQEFVGLIPHLSFGEILQIEVRLNTDWQPLISQGDAKPGSTSVSNNQKSFFCTVCKIYQSTAKNMIDHIKNSNNHNNIMNNNVKEIFHAEYTYPKSSENKQQQNGNTKPLPKNTSALKQRVPPPKATVNQNDKSVVTTTSSSNEKRMVLNPLKINRISDTKTANKTSPANNTTEKSIDVELNEIPEVIIIDDNDDGKPTQNATNDNGDKSEPPEKKPKIMVSSFAKCVENIDEESTNRERENAINQRNEKSSSNEDEKYKIHGFIGVEYVVKICGKKIVTRYECGLCELNLGFDDMQKHLIGYSHRLKFCEKHFPTAIQQFRQYIVDVPADEHYKIMIPVLQKLAEAIEKHHGRAQPFECTQERFFTERIRVLTEVFGRSHASEQDGPTFTHVISSREVDQFISQRNANSHQDKVLKVPVFDNLKPTSSKSSMFTANIPVTKCKAEIDNAPIVKMANEMRKHFRMSQPYHYEAPLPPQPFVEPQLYMGQQPYMHHQPYMQQQLYVEPQRYMRPQREFNPQPIVDDETHKRMVDNFLRANSKDSHSSSRSHRHERYDRNYRHKDSARSSRSSRSPPRSSSSSFSASSSKAHTSNISQDIWRSYCRLVDRKLDALNECYQQYKANPESHPSYQEEWLKFWNRRKTELIAAGKDYRTHDYQPDWVLFFNNRIKELYNEAFEALKIESREELSLPLRNDFVLEKKYYVSEKATDKKKKDKSVEPIVPDVEHKKAMRKQNVSPVERESRSFARQSANSTAATTITMEEEETPTFVSVLRLLTALEEHLGSLGPKIVDLLTKALQAERSSPACALALINEENCSLLETAMEKFKGLVIAGILEHAKERALKKAIAKVSKFLEIAKKARELVAKPSATTSKPASDDALRKTHVIEKKIAEALAAQGHTNLDRDKLGKLATVCMLLDKKKRESTGTTDNQASSSRSHTTGPKPLSDALSDIMGNFGSTSVTARRPPANVTADLGIKRSTTIGNAQYGHASLSSSTSTYANDNLTNTDRNFGNTYNDNVSNFAPHNKRNIHFDEPMTDWSHHKQQQQEQMQHKQQQQQNMASYNYNRNFNRTWNSNQQSSNYYPGKPNMRDPYM